MKIKFLWLGKSKNPAFTSIINDYHKRLKSYTRITIEVLKDGSHGKRSIEEQKLREADQLLKEIDTSDYVVLLDERGKHLSSIELSQWLQHKMNISLHQVIIIIAGPYGVHRKLKDRADDTISLSHMTLTHDMARILILEQVYRAYTILNGEKYHNE